MYKDHRVSMRLSIESPVDKYILRVKRGKRSAFLRDAVSFYIQNGLKSAVEPATVPVPLPVLDPVSDPVSDPVPEPVPAPVPATVPVPAVTSEGDDKKQRLEKLLADW